MMLRSQLISSPLADFIYVTWSTITNQSSLHNYRASSVHSDLNSLFVESNRCNKLFAPVSHLNLFCGSVRHWASDTSCSFHLVLSVFTCIQAHKHLFYHRILELWPCTQATHGFWRVYWHSKAWKERVVACIGTVEFEIRRVWIFNKQLCIA